MVTNFNQLNGS